MCKWMKVYDRIIGKDQGIFLINRGEVAQPKQLYKGLVSGDNNIYKYIGTSAYEFDGDFSDTTKWLIYGSGGTDLGEFANKKLGDGLRLNSGDNSYVEVVHATTSEAGVVVLGTEEGTVAPSEKSHSTLSLGDTLHHNTSFSWSPTGDLFKYTGPTKVLTVGYDPTLDDQAEELALLTDVDDKITENNSKFFEIYGGDTDPPSTEKVYSSIKILELLATKEDKLYDRTLFLSGNDQLISDPSNLIQSDVDFSQNIIAQFNSLAVTQQTSIAIGQVVTLNLWLKSATNRIKTYTLTLKNSNGTVFGSTNEDIQLPNYYTSKRFSITIFNPQILNIGESLVLELSTDNTVLSTVNSGGIENTSYLTFQIDNITYDPSLDISRPIGTGYTQIIGLQKPPEEAFLKTTWRLDKTYIVDNTPEIIEDSTGRYEKYPSGLLTAIVKSQKFINSLPSSGIYPYNWTVKPISNVRLISMFVNQYTTGGPIVSSNQIDGRFKSVFFRFEGINPLIQYQFQVNTDGQIGTGYDWELSAVVEGYWKEQSTPENAPAGTFANEYTRIT